jgi:hypothetical protein
MIVFNLGGGVDLFTNDFYEMFVQIVQQRIVVGGGQHLPPLVRAQIVLK